MNDFNLKLKSFNNERDRVTVLRRAYELGWDCIAWNSCQVGKVVGTNMPQHKRNKTTALSFGDQCEASSVRALVTSSSAKELKQLSRITITIDELVDCQSLTAGNEYLKAFDIVAVCPGNAKVFSYLCKTAEIDLISIDFTHKVPFTLNKKLLDEAVARGIFFEIVYSPLLLVPQMRREVLSGTRTFIQFLRGRNLVLCSGADSSAAMRGPFDVLNVGRVLNLTQAQALEAVSSNCAKLLQHSAARKLRLLPVEVVSKKDCEDRRPGQSVFSASRNAVLRREKSNRLQEERGVQGGRKRARLDRDESDCGSLSEPEEELLADTQPVVTAAVGPKISSLDDDFLKF